MIDPMMAGAPSPAEMQNFHRMLKQLDKGRPKAVNVVASAIDGAILGALIGWAVHRKETGHREIGKHALYGAGIGGGLGLLAYAIFKGASVGAHFVESEAMRELHGAPTLPSDPQYAAGAWGWGWGEHPWGHHHGWGEHERHGWGDHGWGEHQEQPWWHRHRHFSRHRPWHEEVIFEQPAAPAITYGPASAEEQAAAYSHGGLQ